MVAATLSLTNCTEELQVAPEMEKTPYTIFANAAETKTVNDGFSTKWAENDSLNVFHAPVETDFYSYNSKFVLTDLATGQFQTDELFGMLNEANDWYALYPYNEFIETPANTSSGYVAVGSKVSSFQIQKGNDSMAHIAGPNYPMWGVAKNVPDQELPQLTMTHASSLVEVVVTNNADSDLVVKTIGLSASEDIVGTYYIDFTGETPQFTSSGDAYVSDYVRLVVEDGEPIAAGASAKFYFAIKPFTTFAGETLSLSVNGMSKTIDVTEDITFSSGKIKTLKFSVDEVVVTEPGPFTSNMVWTLGENAYDGTSSTAQTAVINDEEVTNLLKLGTSSKYGSATINIPAGTTKIGFYAVSWKGAPATVTLKQGERIVGTADAPANDGATGTPEYTIVAEPSECYFEIVVDAQEDAEYTLSTVGKPRVLIWGLNYYTETGIGESQLPDEPEKPEDPVEPEPDGGTFTWNLAIADYLAADEGHVHWFSEYAAMLLIKAESQTNANNYLGGGTDGEKEYVHTRMYKNQILGLLPQENYRPVKIVFTSTSADYASKFVNSAWTNAVVTSEGNIVTVIPEDATLKVTVTISAATRFTDVTVHYVYDETFLPVDTEEPDPEDPVEPEQPGDAIAVTVAEFLAAAEDDTLYELTGVIQNVLRTDYGNFDLVDETGSVYIYGLVDENRNYIFTDYGLKAGDVITVVGKRGSYKDKPEMIDALYISHTAGEGSEPEPEPEPGEPVVATVADVLAAEVSKTAWYQITGTIKNLVDTTFGNFDLVDETGSIFVYGLTATQVASNDKSFATLGLKEGDVLTLIGTRSEYNGAAQIGGPAYYVSHVPGEEPELPEVPADGTVASVVFADMEYANSEVVADKAIWIDDNVSLMFSQGTAATAPAYYTSGSAIRMYQNGATLTVEANGKTISSIKMTFASGQYYLAPDCGELSAEGSVRTWTGEATSVTFTSTGTDKSHRAYVAAIEVVYN